MNAPILAQWHASEALRINPSSSEAKELKRAVDEALSAWNEDIGPMVESGNCSLEGILEIFRRGEILHEEQFFRSSEKAFLFVIESCTLLGSEMESSSKSHLRSIVMACHLNIAAGCILRQRFLSRAVFHCNQVGLVDINNDAPLPTL